MAEGIIGGLTSFSLNFCRCKNWLNSRLRLSSRCMYILSISLFISASYSSFNRYASLYCYNFRSTFLGDFFTLLGTFASYSAISASSLFSASSFLVLSYLNSSISTSSASFNFTGVATTLLTFLFS